MFGNFEGTETDITQRDFSNNTTFLSGDLYGDDVVSGSFTDLEITGNTENVYHVILVSDINNSEFSAMIDGFTIKGGNANNESIKIVNGIAVSMDNGGGLYVLSKFTVINNCFIVNNSALNGGGIYYSTKNIVINNNIVVSNRATFNGGGIFDFHSISTISNNSFIGNYSHFNGGGIYCGLSDVIILNNEFNGNSTDSRGGGIDLYDATSNISKNTFTNNYANNEGGAIVNYLGTNIIRENTIAYNITDTRGGGIFIFSGINLIVNNLIHNNSSGFYGGGIDVNGTSNTIVNNTFVNNIANADGGGIYIANGTNAITNNLFWNNKLNTEANILSADFFYINGPITFQNNILQLDNSLYIGQNYSIAATTQGNLFAQNPLFLNIDNPQGEDLIYFTNDDGLRLQSNSPAQNAGTQTNAPTTDILGTSRDAIPDIGAYEYSEFVGIQPNTGSTPTASLNAYPNPATDAITFTFTTPTTDNSILLLYAIDGQNITTLYKATTQAGQTNTLTIDTKGFTPGTYCAVLRCGNRLSSTSYYYHKIRKQ